LKFHLHLANQLAAELASGGRLIHAHAICPGSVFTPFWDRIPQRPQSAADCLEADEVAWLVEQVVVHPDWTASDHAEHAPRTEVRIAPHAPWVDEGSVMEIKHVAHD
jgi:NAD(P)-dependent dehydrogenase (short-subunit alcohol dehydrogenase family)